MACKKCPPEGLPAWVMTFADLMSLLMCFFVLLLSFAHMDQVKFREVAGSMKDAFGDDLLAEIPGSMKKMADKDAKSDTEDEKKGKADKEAGAAQAKDIAELKKALAKEIAAGIITVEQGGGKISVQVDQQKAFPSGSAGLLKDIVPVLDKLAGVFGDSEATIHVDGHTDNVPISTTRFRSNWELSAARAASVATIIMKEKGIDPARMEIRGHADTRPLHPNDTPEHRAANRRIEIVMDYSRDLENETTDKEEASGEDSSQGETAESDAVQAPNELSDDFGFDDGVDIPGPDF